MTNTATLKTDSIKSGSTSCLLLKGWIVVPKWLLPSISEVLARREQIGTDNVVSQVGEKTLTQNSSRRVTSRTARERVKAEREWCGAIAALENLLLQVLDVSQLDTNEGEQYVPNFFGDGERYGPATMRVPLQSMPTPVKGLVLAGPVPVFSHPAVISNLQTGIFTAEPFNALALMPFQLPPATTTCTESPVNDALELPLLPSDSLAVEQFCLVFTPSLSLVMVLGENPSGVPAFQFSFDPEDVQQAWRSLRARVLLASPHHINYLDTLVRQFAPTAPDYRIVMQFSREMLKHLPDLPTELEHQPMARTPQQDDGRNPACNRQGEQLVRSEQLGVSEISNSPSPTPNLQTSTLDVELLQALTHEIRTPLTTIRTLTQLLLKRRELPADISRRLEIIDRECTEQINRMELIFRAVELATSEVKEGPVHLTTMSLSQLLQQSIPQWQKQAMRRNVTLDVVLPQKLPAVVSNPVMLDQVLTGLMENFTRSLPAGGHIQVEVIPAGDQLKLQLQSQPHPDETGKLSTPDSKRKSIGQLLMFQPETGSLSLNMNVTKNLVQALGGKLIVRQRPQQGEVLTIFLPLEVGSTGIWSHRETTTGKRIS